MTFQIRTAQLADAAGLTDLIIGFGWFQHYLGSASNEVIQEQIGRRLQFCLANDSHSVYVAENPAGNIVGYIAVHWLPYLFLPGPEGYISELFLRESSRGQGLGSQLLEVVKKEAIQRGCSRLSLLNIRSRESYQRGFYAQRGWEERPEAANFILRLKT